MSLPFDISFGGTLVAQVLTSKLVCAVAENCPAGVELAIVHPADSAVVTFDPAASTRATNKVIAQIGEWAEGLAPTEVISPEQPVSAPTETAPPSETLTPTPPTADLSGDVGQPSVKPSVKSRPTIEEVAAQCKAAVEAREVNGNAVTNELNNTPAERATLDLGTVVQLASGRKYVVQLPHLQPVGSKVICGTPHGDGDFSYRCGNKECDCSKSA